MNRSGLRSRLAALLTAIAVFVGLLSLSSAPVWAEVGTITEFPHSSRLGGPDFITARPDGNLWFTEGGGNKIGRITPGGSFVEFPLPKNCGPSSGCAPSGITARPDGNLWFTDFGGNNIGRITPNVSFTFFPIPSFHNNPFDITAGPDGNLWFTEENAGKIGRITTK